MEVIRNWFIYVRKRTRVFVSVKSSCQVRFGVESMYDDNSCQNGGPLLVLM